MSKGAKFSRWKELEGEGKGVEEMNELNYMNVAENNIGSGEKKIRPPKH